MTIGLTRRQLLALSSATAGGAVLAGTAPAAAEEGHENYDETIASHDGTDIAMTIYRPTEAAAAPVPTILH